MQNTAKRVQATKLEQNSFQFKQLYSNNNNGEFHKQTVQYQSPNYLRMCIKNFI